MEVDNNKLRDSINPVSEQQPIFLSDSNYSNIKPYNIKDIDDEFPFEVSSPKNNLVQHDFHRHRLFHIHESSPNPMHGVQTGCIFNFYDTFTYGSSSNNNIDFHDYECKTFANNNNNNLGHGQVMDNFLSLPPQHMSMTFQEMKNIDLVVPDEVSCVTANNFQKKVYMNKNKALQQPYAKSRNRKKNNVVKGQWTADEDSRLVQLVEQFGVRKWSHIALMLPGRIGKQCRERWHNHLRPDIKKDTWSEEEDKVLIQAHSEIGNKWAEIAKRLPGRTENSIKNHWNATKRRQYSKRKCRSKYPRGNLLQEYIKSLNLDSNSAGRFLGRSNSSVTDVLASNSAASTLITVPGQSQQLQFMDFCQNNDRLVPNYDFNEVPDFDFDEKMFQGGCSIDSLLDDMPCAPVLPNKAFDLDLPVGDGAPLMDFEVKKELDLVEMISESRNIRP